MTKLTVINHEGILVTDSRDVAEMVGKEHKNLLRDIKNYVTVLTSANLSPSEFFIESSYLDAKNEKRICYLLTKKGCDMTANKMIGEKGILFTATYVTRFEEMEKELKSKIVQHSYTIEDSILRAERWIEEQKEKLLLEQRVKEYEPKVTYHDEVLNSPGLVTVTSIAKDYGMSGSAMNATLNELGAQYKQGNIWLLYAKHQEFGYTKTYTYKNGRVSMKWTQKGRLFIYQLLKENGILPTIEKETA